MKRRDLVATLITTLGEDNVEMQDDCAFALANLSKDCNL
jgi:hypothetical protein